MFFRGLVQKNDCRDGCRFGDVLQDNHPKVCEMGAVRGVAISVCRLGYVGDDADQDGDKNELKGKDPFSAIPSKHVDWLLGLLGLLRILLFAASEAETLVGGGGQVHAGEEERTLVLVRGNELEEQEEEIAEGECLHDVLPWHHRHLSLRPQNAKKAINRVYRLRNVS